MWRSLCVGIAVVIAWTAAADAAVSIAATSISAPSYTAAQPDSSDQIATSEAARPADSSSEVPNQQEPPVPVQVKQRLLDNLTDELRNNFGLFLYVSKAERGPWAQRMYVYQKTESGDLYLLYDWPVSTGREQLDIAPSGHALPTNTPTGYFELDPHRSYARYRSSQWNEPMPYAIFFDLKDKGVPTGLAIHGADDDHLQQLGTRASAGCIRLAPENAKVLFNLIRDSFKGFVPTMGFDRVADTTMTDGMLAHDVNGNLKFSVGYRVLVFIDEYGGSQDLQASLF